MRAPSVPGYAHMCEVGGMRAMSSFQEATTSIDVWVMHNYLPWEMLWDCISFLDTPEHLDFELNLHVPDVYFDCDAGT